MRTILWMIRKDLLRKLRAPLGIAVMLLFPIFFALILAVSFGGGESPRVHLLVENRDDSLLGGALTSLLGSDQVAEYFDVEAVGEDGIERLRKGRGSALLRIPEDFTGDFLDGEPTTLELYRNPAQGILPEVAEQLAGLLTELLSAASRVLRGPLDTVGPFTGEESSASRELSDQTVAEAAVAFKAVFDGAGKFLSPIVIDFESVLLGEDGEALADEGTSDDSDEGSPSPVFSIFLLVFPAVSVWSLFMIGDAAMRDILVEHDAGTLHRQLHAPIGAFELVLAKAGFTAVVALIALAILTAIGSFATDQPVDPAGYVVLSLALVLAVTGAGAAIYGAAGSQTRGSTVASVIYLTLGFAGGSFIPVSSLPGVVQALAPISPFYWGTQGYQELLLNAGGLRDVLQPVGVLSLLGLALLALGAIFLHRQLAKGAA